MNGEGGPGQAAPTTADAPNDVSGESTAGLRLARWAMIAAHTRLMIGNGWPSTAAFEWAWEWFTEASS